MSVKQRTSQSTTFVPRMSTNTVEILAKQTTLINLSSATINRNNSVFSTYSAYSEESSHWSWKSLKKEFKAKDVGKMFLKYQSRLQHTFFMVLLTLNILFDIIAIIVYFFDKKNRESFPGIFLIRNFYYDRKYREQWPALQY
ncbi:uncharacterized protein LOC128963637 [Oppia nitens]|uniref:uncharacterized protein LOC128963637 n=1 Tax=Oppia nitens TaxID=1686743 RepID=UPI0023DBEB70|nr:uncharacterized protein LOC128963637 [Oppia nitens]